MTGKLNLNTGLLGPKQVFKC